MAVCEKCWREARIRAMATHRSQHECYLEILEEKEDKPCTPEEQKGVTMYDPTANMIKTPDGWGKYVEFNPTTGKVTVEMDHSYLVEYDGEDCYI